LFREVTDVVKITFDDDDGRRGADGNSVDAIAFSAVPVLKKTII
jgi:hypothetical protein